MQDTNKYCIKYINKYLNTVINNNNTFLFMMQHFLFEQNYKMLQVTKQKEKRKVKNQSTALR